MSTLLCRQNIVLDLPFNFFGFLSVKGNIDLSLKKIELIFFMEAHTELCFRFVIKKVLITHLCSIYCYDGLSQIKSLLFVSHSLLSKHREGGKEETQVRQMIPNNQSNILYYIM